VLDDAVIVEARVRLRVVERQIGALNAEVAALRRLLGQDRNGGMELAVRAREVLRQDGPMHYRDLATLVCAGGENPAATLLTQLHRYPGVRQVGNRTGIWEAA
jgi:hypothetical protein